MRQAYCALFSDSDPLQLTAEPSKAARSSKVTSGKTSFCRLVTQRSSREGENTTASHHGARYITHFGAHSHENGPTHKTSLPPPTRSFPPAPGGSVSQAGSRALTPAPPSCRRERPPPGRRARAGQSTRGLRPGLSCGKKIRKRNGKCGCVGMEGGSMHNLRFTPF